MRPERPQVSDNHVCRSLQGVDCICTKLRAVRPSELGPIGPPSERFVDEGSMEVTVPSCVVEPVTYDSDSESQGISDVESEGHEAQAVPDWFAGGWGYSRDHPDGVSHNTHPSPEPAHNIQTSRKTPESNASSLAGSFRSMRKILRHSISSRAKRRAFCLQHGRGRYSLTHEIFSSIIEWAGNCPAVDVFGTSEMRRKQIPKYWGSKAWDEPWNRDFIYLHPQYHQMKDVITKMLLDQARGSIVVPVAQSWFWAMAEAPVDWWVYLLIADCFTISQAGNWSRRVTTPIS